jgi:hypothetical protein
MLGPIPFQSPTHWIVPPSYIFQTEKSNKSPNQDPAVPCCFVCIEVESDMTWLKMDVTPIVLLTIDALTQNRVTTRALS